MKAIARLKGRSSSWLRRVSPLAFYVVKYRRASEGLVRTSSSIPNSQSPTQLFEDFVQRNRSNTCLQIGVKEHIGQKFGSNWVSVDKYDYREFIDFNYDVHDLEFEDESFDAIVCWSILEHIPYPQQALAELHRVLRPNGEIWVQLPFLYPYHEAPKDYWRVTPDGLRVWMSEFTEQYCGCEFWDRTALVSATYYLGTKSSAQE